MKISKLRQMHQDNERISEEEYNQLIELRQAILSKWERKK